MDNNNPTETDISTAKPASPEIASSPHRPFYILPLIVCSQFSGTALWFAGNAVLGDLVSEDGPILESSLSYLTSSVQLGFIIGTLVFALLNIADRFLPTRVFMISALLGAGLNALIPAAPGSLAALLLLRFFTGFFLAGIYPVGMKVAADWYAAGLGKALGWLVGALAFGSSLPFLLRQINQPWQALLWETSAIAATGGLAVGCFVPNGPYRQVSASKMRPSLVWTMFRGRPLFRDAALAYWGHMWELYAFWTWCPVVWEAYLENLPAGTAGWLTPSIVTFGVIAVGGLGCVLGGYASLRIGSAWVAAISLIISGLACFLSPALFRAPLGVALAAYALWGMAVVADSPQFSTLVAQTAPTESKGTALTIVNSVGFAITIGSIQLLAVPISEQYLFLLLAPGPLFGLWSLRRHVALPVGGAAAANNKPAVADDQVVEMVQGEEP